MDERVLVIPESHFRAVGYFEGFRAYDADYASRLLDATRYSFLPRSVCETQPAFKQLIPYVILTRGDEVFSYRRGSKGTEMRLQSLRSLGIGGHISEADAAGEGDAYAIGMARELAEEVALEGIISQTLLGFIYDPSTAVGQVHLGVVHRLEVTGDVIARDDALADAGFISLVEARRDEESFESWSRLVLSVL